MNRGGRSVPGSSLHMPNYEVLPSSSCTFSKLSYLLVLTTVIGVSKTGFLGLAFNKEFDFQVGMGRNVEIHT